MKFEVKCLVSKLISMIKFFPYTLLISSGLNLRGDSKNKKSCRFFTRLDWLLLLKSDSEKEDSPSLIIPDKRSEWLNYVFSPALRLLILICHGINTKRRMKRTQRFGRKVTSVKTLTPQTFLSFNKRRVEGDCEVIDCLCLSLVSCCPFFCRWTERRNQSLYRIR